MFKLIIPIGILMPFLADAGLPMIFIVMPVMGIAFVPVVLLEAFILLKRLHLSWKKAFNASLISNVVSTVAGIPLTWLACVILEMVVTGGKAFGVRTLWQKFLSSVVQSPWLVPYNDSSWQIPTALAALLIPFFFVSWWIEYVTARKFLSREDIARERILKAELVANLLSYSFLLLIGIVFIAYSISPNIFR